MEKFKICPVCGMHNKPNMIECIGCETDLTSVKATDEATEQAKITAQENTSENVEEKWLWYYAEERLYLICNEYISPRTGEVTRTYFLKYGTSPLDAFSKIGKVVKNER